uniref:macro domain-containing protein n=1 Tax=Herbidospora sakaeratensis TaxID=564415 RepID=UPI000781F738|nr:macro domain-containing protein [Herbidospora sakaeratensis]
MSFPPSREALIADLRVLREKGLLRRHSLELAALTAVCRRLALPVERVLDLVIGRLDGKLAEAAAHSMGMTPGMRDWPGQERRARAARVYGVSVERFRKHHELLVLGELAQGLLDLAGAPGRGRPRLGGSVEFRFRGVPILTHRRPIETLRDVDVLVSSENVYLEMSKPFKATLSATLRKAAAVWDPSGRLVDDVLPRELRGWLREHGREGEAVAAGTVVPTSSGELARQGVNRVYHAAVAVPRAGANDYDVDATAVMRAVHNVFDLAGTEGWRSVALPLLGAGRGGLQPEVAFAYVWAALESRLDQGLLVHLVTRSERSSEALTKGLRAAGAEHEGAGGG